MTVLWLGLVLMVWRVIFVDLKRGSLGPQLPCKPTLLQRFTEKMTDILNEWCARGDIDREEFARMKLEIAGS